MGWCHEFGVQVREGCGHPVTAGDSACHCTVCGVVCEGQFAGCEAVWARGPREVTLLRPDGQRAGDRPVAAVEAERGPESDLYLEDGRGEVLEWLRVAFEGVRADLTVLSNTVARQQRAIAKAARHEPDGDRLLEVADALPARVATAVSEAVRAHPSATGNGGVSADVLAELADVLLHSVTTAVRDALEEDRAVMKEHIDQVAAELRQEMARLAHQSGPAESGLDQTAERAERPLTTLAHKMQSLAARSDWQETLRALRATRRHPSGD